MSIDIYVLCNMEFLTSNVERACENLATASSLEDAIKFKPNPENKEGLKYYFSFCLSQIQEKGMEIDMSYLKILEESFELFKLAPEHLSIFFITLDEIFTNLIRMSNDENEILKCACLASKLRYIMNEGPSSLSLAYTKLTPFIYRTFSNLVSTPKRQDYLKILDTLTKGVEYGLNFLQLAKKVAKYALEFLEDINNINQDQDSSQESPNEDIEIIRYIEKLNIGDGDFEAKLAALKKFVSKLNPNPFPLSQPYINFEELKIEQRIYNRSHSHIHIKNDFIVQVFKGSYRNKLVAVKIYSAKTFDPINKFDKEIENNIKLNESRKDKKCCFIKFYGFYKRENKNNCEIGLIMKYVEKTLISYIKELKENNDNISENTLMEMYQSLINSFTIMHDLKIYHLDIKPHNILIKNITNGHKRLYIIDLGSSEKFHDGESESLTESVGELRLIQGTKAYMAPEMVDRLNREIVIAEYKRSKADVFSLGMTLLQLCTLDNLYEGLNTSSNNDKLFLLVKKVPFDWARNILIKMLSLDPKQRPKFIELKKEIKNAETWTYSISNSSPLLQTTNFGSLELENPIKSFEINQLTIDYYTKKINQELILIKSYSIISPEQINELAEELDIYKKLSQAKGPNLDCFLIYYEASSFHNIRNSAKNICTIMQYCEENLMGYISNLKKSNRSIDDNLMFNMCKSLIFSFAHMHNMKIYHLNIKPHNILINENRRLFITGFGTLNKKIEESDKNNYGELIQNTKGYEPPEIVGGSGNFDDEHKKKIDVFSLGITLLQMMTLEYLGNCRHTDPINNELLLMINRIPYEWAKNIVRSMIRYNPEDRPSFVDLIENFRNIETLTYSYQQI